MIQKQSCEAPQRFPSYVLNAVEPSNRKIRIFQNEEFGQFRVADIDGEPMFCLADVAKALRYTNPAKAVIDHCKGVPFWEPPPQTNMERW